ncbi:hypothetical protein [Mongoliitalea lutea]|uniref:Outer membrane protein beta-barrel domain-containing protein n=1 Tax=Mongoliitalea lutea TaxID=849756 RepID=A0A8J3CZM1_9BACT|nr:hypothetical protein [Mongoliitalea lutea]GHB53126.1 hypothetical protein GCM10008106_37090 [Mongoliitalea lutea]
MTKLVTFKSLGLTFLMMFSLYAASVAQDVIFKKNEEVITAQVVEVLEDRIKYKKWDNLDGPVYNLLKSEILLIKYQNGYSESFEGEESSKSTTVNKGTPKASSVAREKSSSISSSGVDTSDGFFALNGNYLGVAVGPGVLLGSAGYNVRIPYLSIRFDRVLKEVGEKGFLSAGGFGAYQAYGIDLGALGDISQSVFVIGAGGAYHYNFTDRLSVVSGLRFVYFGYNTSSTSNNMGNFGLSVNGTGFDFYGSIYYGLSSKGAVFLEAGSGLSYVNVGYSIVF